MGNGASVKFDSSGVLVNVKHSTSMNYNLAAVEKLCRNGYFQQNFSSLSQAVKLSIEKEALDVLEVLGSSPLECVLRASIIWILKNSII